MPVSIAQLNDIPGLESLLNNAYRGDASKKGWTTEADLLSGELRTDAANLRELMELPDAVFLKNENEQKQITGCVFLQKTTDRLYLGMLSVSPLEQNKGIGKKLLASETAHAKATQCRSIYMRVISIRHELVAWYERHGYHHTGKMEPLKVDQRFGIPTQPLEFSIMEKTVR